jgi:hypothetical protein
MEGQNLLDLPLNHHPQLATVNQIFVPDEVFRRRSIRTLNP